MKIKLKKADEGFVNLTSRMSSDSFSSDIVVRDLGRYNRVGVKG